MSIMDGHVHHQGKKHNYSRSRVVKIDSEHSWDSFITLAKDQGYPVVVHFTAAWCAPSVAMNSCFGELALKYRDTLFLTVDVDDVREVALKMDVKAMPTFLIMKEGDNQVDKLVGANPEAIRRSIKASFSL